MSRQDEINSIISAFQEVHPSAKPIHTYNLDGFRVWVQDAPSEWKGTADPEHLVMLPAERKQGITVHLWDPRKWQLLQDHEARLIEAGFKVMVGCLQWNRKAPVDVDALRAVFADTKS